MSNRHKPGATGRDNRGHGAPVDHDAAADAQEATRDVGSAPEEEEQRQDSQQSAQQSDVHAHGLRNSTEATGESVSRTPGEPLQETQDTETEADNLTLKARVAELEAELSELKEQYLRKQADFENSRKRMQREKEDAIAFANKQLLLDMVAIIDDFERAIQSAEESRDFDSFHDGIVLIEKQLVGMLERKWALKRFESAGEPFDPQCHEALMTEEVPDHEQSMVLEDFQKGYMLNDKVLRAAKVKVSVPASRP